MVTVSSRTSLRKSPVAADPEDDLLHRQARWASLVALAKRLDGAVRLAAQDGVISDEDADAVLGPLGVARDALTDAVPTR